jgi:tetratricopeptide (TPR) repeat protein
MSALALALALAAASPPSGGPAGAEARLRAADALYLDGDLDGAVRGYEALEAEGWDGAGLQLALGNARLLLGRRGLAIVSYERALRLDPWDPDARENLALARGSNPDRLPLADRSAVERAVRRVPERGAALALAAAWAALWAALAAGRRAPGRLRVALSAAAIAAAVASAAAGAAVAAAALDRRHPAAIVIAPATPAREGPARALRAAFQLHEGTRVRIVGASGDLVRIRLENGLEGWVAAEDVERI